MKKYISLLSLFCVAIVIVSAQNITRLEYSIDGFVAEGKGTALTVSGNSIEVENNIDIDISLLEPGNHTINIRAMNEDGIWSLPVSKSFVIIKPDTTKVENVMYRFYNETYQGVWMSAPVDPARKNIDSIFKVSTAGVDLEQEYTIEFYAKNSMDVRGFSVFLTNVDLQLNNQPERVKDTLKLAIDINQQLDVEMDTLFTDADLIVGDSLKYSLEDLDTLLLDFSSWTSSSILTFTPSSQNSGIYKFLIKTSDLAGESDSVPVELVVRNATGIYSENNQNTFLIYPNPVSEILTIKNLLKSESTYKLSVYTSDGRLIFIDIVTDSEYKLPLADFPRGIYVISLINDEFAFRKKIIRK